MKILSEDIDPDLGHHLDKLKDRVQADVDLIFKRSNKRRAGLSKYGRGEVMERPVDPAVAFYYHKHNLMLRRSPTILEQDVILHNKFNVLEPETTKEAEGVEHLTFLEDFLQDNNEEIASAVGDLSLYGAGCLVMKPLSNKTRVNHGRDYGVFNGFSISHSPQRFLQVVKVTDVEDTGAVEFFAQEMDVNNLKDKPTDYRMIGESYESVYSQGLDWCLWIGRDKHYDFYREPDWYAYNCLDALNTQIAIGRLWTNKVRKGFNMNNFLLIQKPKMFTKLPEEKETKGKQDDNAPNAPKADGNEDLLSALFDDNKILDSQCKNTAGYGDPEADELAENMYQAQVGTAAYLKEIDPRYPWKIDNITLTDTNYSQLEAIYKSADQMVMSAFGIPRERYMINDMSESMNSHKTEAFWEIYTKNLRGLQKIITRRLDSLASNVFLHNFELDIEVPMFSVLINEKINTYRELYHDGLLTGRMALVNISKYVSGLNADDWDNGDLWLDRRYIGNSLVSTGETKEEAEAKVIPPDLEIRKKEESKVVGKG